jgi:hypothetical protein
MQHLAQREPEDATNFVLDLDFTKYPFEVGKKMWVRVDTTTKNFVEEIQLTWFDASRLAVWKSSRPRKKKE